MFFGYKRIRKFFSKIFTNYGLSRDCLLLMTGKRLERVLEVYFNTKINIKPLFAEYAMISLDQTSIEDFIDKKENDKKSSCSIFLFKKWNKFKHSRLGVGVLKGFGSWKKIRNLPLDYWSRKAFEAIGANFGRLESRLH